MQNIDPTVSVLISILSALVGYLFSRWGERAKTKRTIAKERFDKLYNPFVALVIQKRRLRACDFMDLSEETREEILIFLCENVTHADMILYDIIMEFIMVYEVEMDEEACDRVNQLYQRIDRFISAEWNRMRNYLYWPWYKRILMSTKKVFVERQMRKEDEATQN